jgi:hypothetical protein
MTTILPLAHIGMEWSPQSAGRYEPEIEKLMKKNAREKLKASQLRTLRTTFDLKPSEALSKLQLGHRGNRDAQAVEWLQNRVRLRAIGAIKHGFPKFCRHFQAANGSLAALWGKLPLTSVCPRHEILMQDLFHFLSRQCNKLQNPQAWKDLLLLELAIELSGIYPATSSLQIDSIEVDSLEFRRCSYFLHESGVIVVNLKTDLAYRMPRFDPRRTLRLEEQKLFAIYQQEDRLGEVLITELGLVERSRSKAA